MLATLAETKANQCYNHADRPWDNNIIGSMSIQYWSWDFSARVGLNVMGGSLTGLRSRGVQEEAVCAKDPANAGLGIVLELMLTRPCMENAQAIKQSHRRDHRTPCSKHHQPGLESALGIYMRQI